jgi:hypothetical protein
MQRSAMLNYTNDRFHTSMKLDNVQHRVVLATSIIRNKGHDTFQQLKLPPNMVSIQRLDFEDDVTARDEQTDHNLSYSGPISALRWPIGRKPRGRQNPHRDR